jgi:purine-binding chemotaxis protein CheW
MTDEPGSNPELASPEQALQILKDRARALALPVERVPSPHDEIHVVEFRLGNEHFALERDYVREVHPLRNLTPVPCTPSFITGIVNVRGQILPALDLHRFFNRSPGGLTDLHVVIIMEVEGIELGILADAVESARAIAETTCKPISQPEHAAYAAHAKAVTDDGLLILDASAILKDPKIVVNEEVGMPASAQAALPGGEQA